MNLRHKIKEVCAQYGIKKTYIAKMAGISSSALSQYLHGKINLLPENEARLAKVVIEIEKKFGKDF